MMKPITRFTLEDQIMECWGVVDDLDMVYSNEALYQNEDRMMNVLLGMQELYRLRFERLFQTFEHLIHEGKIT
tara:strand:+ start:76 stop:294 length:219 start_codon:yes stop_codon:yes gene_type:complete